MSVYSVTVNLSEPSYRRVQRAAKRTQRSVEQLLGDAVVALLPETGDLSLDLTTALAQMAFLNDAVLWQMARTTLSTEQQRRLEVLHDKQQRTQLSPIEREEERALVRLYRETQFVRAQAIVLLQQRGYDVSDPEQFVPVI